MIFRCGKARAYKWHGNINGIDGVKEIEAAKKKGQAAKYFILGDNGYGGQYGLYTPNSFKEMYSDEEEKRRGQQ